MNYKHLTIAAFISVIGMGAMWHDGDGLTPVDEYQLRLVLIEKLVQYYEYAPEARYKKVPAGPFRFGIVGKKNPFGVPLDAYKTENKFKSRSIEVVHYTEAADYNDIPDLLYVPAEETHRLLDYAVQLSGKPCLVIVEERSVNIRNSCMGIFKNEGKIKVDLNYEVLEKNGFHYEEGLLKYSSN